MTACGSELVSHARAPSEATAIRGKNQLGTWSRRRNLAGRLQSRLPPRHGRISNVSQRFDRPPLAEPDQSLWSAIRISAWHDAMREPAVTPLAVLRIPKIRLEVAVLPGTDDRTLDRGVGQSKTPHRRERTGTQVSPGTATDFFAD